MPPVDPSGEGMGKRLARLRKHAGLTQAELAARIGIIQVLISDYEQEKLRLSAEMAARFAKALHVSVDEIVGLKTPKKVNGELPVHLVRRLKGIEQLPAHQRKVLLRMIDAFLRGAEK